MIEQNKIAWLAGLIDGEGSFCLVRGGLKNNKKRYLKPQVQVANTNTSIILEAKAIMEAILGKEINMHIGNPSGKKRCYYLWTSNQRDCTIMCETILPYIIGKKDQARLMLEFFKKKGTKYSLYSPELTEYGEKMHELNQRTYPPVETKRVAPARDEAIVRAARIQEGAEQGRNDLAQDLN